MVVVNTSPETNMEVNNQWFVDVFPFSNGYFFSGVSFGGGVKFWQRSAEHGVNSMNSGQIIIIFHQPEISLK